MPLERCLSLRYLFFDEQLAQTFLGKQEAYEQLKADRIPAGATKEQVAQ